MHIEILISFYLTAVCLARNSFPDYTSNDFQQTALNLHNQYRAKHRAPPLRIDNGAVQYAKSRCQRISQYNGLNHGHAGLVYGENLYWGGGSGLQSGTEGIKSWYNEVNRYNYNNPGFTGGTGHFTQLVWKSTSHVGCARCGGRGERWYETYVVCNYKPAGNMMGANNFRNNVLRN